MKQFHTSYKSVDPDIFTEVQQLFLENQEQFESYIDQLLWWNNRINLVSRNVPRETIEQHVVHSLLISQFPFFKEASFIIDAGTGGGLPGIPLAITHPHKTILLNDIVSKKIRGVRHIIKHIGLQNTQTTDASIGALALDRTYLLISKHAFKIADLWSMCKNKPWSEMVFLKGLPFEEEVPKTSSPLIIQAHKLETGTKNPFYKDKAIVHISK